MKRLSLLRRPEVAFRTYHTLIRTPKASPITSWRPLPSTTLKAAAFSTSSQLQARKGKAPKKDQRIVNIRYHLAHPKTPRPLRFSRLRALRHWTIHRAWQLFRRKQRQSAELELERQYNSMREACEALRLIGDNGMEDGKDVGRLYRIAMEKKGIWEGIPIEYARIQTHGPSREGWNYEWTR